MNILVTVTKIFIKLKFIKIISQVLPFNYKALTIRVMIIFHIYSYSVFVKHIPEWFASAINSCFIDIAENDTYKYVGERIEWRVINVHGIRARMRLEIERDSWNSKRRIYVEVNRYSLRFSA